MFIVTPKTVNASAALKMKQVPRKFVNRVSLFPRPGQGQGTTLRMVFEVQTFRYTLPLLPFLAIGLTWQNTALALAQAPILMVLLIGMVEMKLLRLSPKARAALIDETGAERGLDLLRVRSVSLLTRVAAGQGITSGMMHMVVEQSELARLPPLTYVSVQFEPEGGGPVFLDLTKAEMAMIREELLAAPLDEQELYRINMMQGKSLRMTSFDPAQVSAHARLAALMGSAGQ